MPALIDAINSACAAKNNKRMNELLALLTED